MRSKGLDLRQRVSYPAVVARIPGRLREADVDLRPRQSGAVTTDHLGGLAGTEQPLERLALVRFGTERMHTI